MQRLMHSLVLVLAACSGGSTHPHDPVNDPKPAPTGDPTCPLEVPGTSINVEDTQSGAALVFVTTGDAAAVRTRAQALATMQQKRDGAASAFGMMFPKDWAAAEKDIDGGARVEFGGADAGAIQSELRMHASHLSSGSCAM